MTDLYRPASPIGHLAGPLLPETQCLQDCLSDMAWDELDLLDSQDARRVASYHAKPEPNAPFLKFRIDGADPNLMRFVGQETVGFEVLQATCAGFQFHWRSDLSRAFEEQVPLLSRIYGLAGPQEIVVEHLLVPHIRKHRVREVRGWFIFSQDAAACSDLVTQSAGMLFRRTEQAKPVQLPTRLWDPERKRTRSAGLFWVVNRGWREAKEPRRP